MNERSIYIVALYATKWIGGNLNIVSVAEASEFSKEEAFGKAASHLMASYPDYDLANPAYSTFSIIDDVDTSTPK